MGLYSSEDITNLTNNEISERNIKCKICTRHVCNYMSTKIQLLRELHILVKALNKIDNEPGDRIFGVCNKCIRKMTDYFFTILDEGTESLENGTAFIYPKENATLIKHFGPMYIDFDEYPTYSGTISKKN